MNLFVDESYQLLRLLREYFNDSISINCEKKPEEG
jgi:hypothetical protein